ncbi:class I SAM-dependent methyltransferase [Tautonia sociabilis]|uniref:Class I SAM-dependent methyltransferase n=1 Tax=Tautonia sociabilis TaxID=2080755 RepID=A0A432MK01_9BACT|nr:class I SAM-dependent methyltransferase [Tautonia sociabilis]RUL87732.1 class I SAM-dependent methyltransferase [Tautonia sociabilis]
MNPYRDAFYSRQAEWHGYAGPEDVRRRHEQRIPYYSWYTRGWLDLPRNTPILDIGCGSGQFLYFLRSLGFTDTVGIDLDSRQVEIGRSLGLDCRNVPAGDFLEAMGSQGKSFGLIALLDIIEHFTRAELFPFLEAVVSRLRPGGSLLMSVPNAESPRGLTLLYADITHELAFTPVSFGELMLCHGLMNLQIRDPWPAPVCPSRRVYRAVVGAARAIEAARLRLLGLEPPRNWSPVIWALAKKPAADPPSH